MRAAVKSPPHPSCEERRAQIMSAALDVIAEKGLEGVRTRDIAARVPINVATLHYYFPSKAELLTAVTDYVRDLFIAQVSLEGTHASGDPVMDFVARGWGAVRRNPSLGPAILEITARAPRDADARKAVALLYRSWHAGLSEVLRDGVAQGRYRADLDVDEAADIMLSFMIGSRFLGLTTARPARVRHYVERLCSLFTGATCPVRAAKRRAPNPR